MWKVCRAIRGPDKQKRRSLKWNSAGIFSGRINCVSALKLADFLPGEAYTIALLKNGTVNLYHGDYRPAHTFWRSSSTLTGYRVLIPSDIREVKQWRERDVVSLSLFTYMDSGAVKTGIQIWGERCVWCGRVCVCGRLLNTSVCQDCQDKIKAQIEKWRETSTGPFSPDPE